ncbi:hypothetical protein MRX96_008303 [Rhipicephalus microplus]
MLVASKDASRQTNTSDLTADKHINKERHAAYLTVVVNRAGSQGSSDGAIRIRSRGLDVRGPFIGVDKRRPRGPPPHCSTGASRQSARESDRITLVPPSPPCHSRNFPPSIDRLPSLSCPSLAPHLPRTRARGEETTRGRETWHARQRRPSPSSYMARQRRELFATERACSPQSSTTIRAWERGTGGRGWGEPRVAEGIQRERCSDALKQLLA